MLPSAALQRKEGDSQEMSASGSGMHRWRIVLTWACSSGRYDQQAKGGSFNEPLVLAGQSQYIRYAQLLSCDAGRPQL